MTDEQRLSASLRFLSSASKTLASSFDYSMTLALIGDLVVPQFACGFVVAIRVGDEEQRIAATGAVHDPSDESQTSLLVYDFELAARGRAFGTLRLTREAASHPLDPIERELFEELAVRIAVAVDSAQIYAREHHVADTLQRALLPDRLPIGDGQRFDAAYLPGAEESIVGGDWYDAFALPDGRIALSIGDVAGHGLRAAIVMGEVRQAFRAAALNPKSPSLVLERANTILNMRSTPVMVTAIFGIIDRATSTLTYASAGHPAPILALPDGTALRLPTEGLPLGIAERIEARDWTFSLPPGSLAALYTDGLIEYSRDILAGEERLIEAMRAEARMPSPNPAGSLVRRVFDQAKNSDDVAVLSVAIDDAPSDTFTFNFSAIPMAVPLVRRSLAHFAARVELDPEETFRLITAVGEALANAVEHAYPDEPGIIRLRITNGDGQLHISVDDDGRWKPAQKRDERGRGLPLMRALMNGVEIRTHQSHTSVRLTLIRNQERAAAIL